MHQSSTASREESTTSLGSVGPAIFCYKQVVATPASDRHEGAFLARLGGDEFTVIATGGMLPTSAGPRLPDACFAAVSRRLPHRRSAPAAIRASASALPCFRTTGATRTPCWTMRMPRSTGPRRRGGAPSASSKPRWTSAARRRALQYDLRAALDGRARAALSAAGDGRRRHRRLRGAAALGSSGRGLVSPDVFIPLAEETGLIVSLGDWVLREGLREAASWPKPLLIAVNLSPVQFRHGDLAATRACRSCSIPASRRDRLELEITEGVLLDDFDARHFHPAPAEGLGVRIAMDDFGTGYSSLAYLQRSPSTRSRSTSPSSRNLETKPRPRPSSAP